MLRSAEVVVCTLSSAGGELLALARSVAEQQRPGQAGASSAAAATAARRPSAIFDVLIVDEAAQAVEPAALVPLQLLKQQGKVRCIATESTIPAFFLDFLTTRSLNRTPRVKCSGNSEQSNMNECARL